MRFPITLLKILFVSCFVVGDFLHGDEDQNSAYTEEATTLFDSVKEEKWKDVIQHATFLITEFPLSSSYQEALYLRGLAYFQIEAYKLSYEDLNTYLKATNSLSHFREAFELKFQLARKFQEGYKRPIAGWSLLPNLPIWVYKNNETALSIYNEIIQAMPGDNLAADALFFKGTVLLDQKEYTSSIETHQTLIQRFPTHPNAVKAYVEIAKTYLAQSEKSYPDTDYLHLASLNLQKFQQQFPNDLNHSFVEEMFKEMEEIFAENLFERAQFYEKTKKNKACILYYSKIIKTFPKTETAKFSQKKLDLLTTSAN